MLKKLKYSTKDAHHHGGATNLNDIYIPAIKPPKERITYPTRHSNEKAEVGSYLRKEITLLGLFRENICKYNNIIHVKQGTHHIITYKFKYKWIEYYNPLDAKEAGNDKT